MAVAVSPAWTEEIARAWADDTWVSRTWLAASRGRARWFDPVELAPRYRSLDYATGRCFEAALSAVATYPHLSTCAGFVFYASDSSRGARHFWTVDRNGHVVDPALTIHPAPAGYLGGPIETEYVEFLARRAGVAMPEHLAERLRVRRRAEKARQRAAVAA